MDKLNFNVDFRVPYHEKIKLLRAKRNFKIKTFRIIVKLSNGPKHISPVKPVCEKLKRMKHTSLYRTLQISKHLLLLNCFM